MLFLALQTIISILLIAAILLQMQGSGLSTAFAGGGEFYRSRRSVEKLLITLTVILSLAFAMFSLLLVIPL